MGVQGLLKRLNKEFNEWNLPKETVAKGSTLIIDGNGLLFHLMSLELATLHGLSVDRQYGGNYCNFDGLARKEIYRLTVTLGLTLVVYFDGDDSYLKCDTSVKRRKRIMEEWDALHLSTYADARIVLDDMPLPPFAKDQMVFALKAMNIEIVTCKQEADQDIALACYNRNKVNPGNCFCLSGDSDFMVMRDCPFIHFNDLIRNADGTYLDDTDTEIVVRVWRRSDIAAGLRITESQLVELCIAIGNDFTAHFPRNHYLPVDPSSGGCFQEGYHYSVIDDIVDQISNSDADFQLSVKNSEELETAVRYSRAMYELEDLSGFHTAVNLTPKIKGDDMDYTRLNAIQTEALAEWLQCEEENIVAQLASSTAAANGSESTSDSGSQLDIAALVIAFLAESIANKDSSEDEVDKAFDSFNEVNTAALQLMLEYLRDNKRVDTDAAPRVSWANLLVANTYQLLVRAMRKSVVKMFPERRIIFESPSTYFDGKTFHHIMEYLEGAVEAAAAEDSEPLEDDFPAIVPQGKDVLPIDAYREQILRKIDSDRVVIIHGETGCGKSTRIPVMLLEEAERLGKKCKMMVSQPRRIAAQSLMKRLRGTMGERVGMRMGHGVRDESDETQVYFVTTGYLVRLMASNPKIFRRHTHLVIDEVHERSVDGDVLCLLARKLLQVHPTLRIILMSATVHTDLYREYFSEEGFNYGDLDCLSVGLRRFPLKIKYAEDLLESKFLPPKVRANVSSLLEICSRCTGKVTDNIPQQLVKNQYQVAETIIRSECANGTGVLVFVSGIADITEMQGRFEGLSKYRVFAIHSDIPYEEQEGAFLPVERDEVKVVIATNAAESSITLPDCDYVICLGTHKATAYQGNSARIQLINTWVSKASATQRAGRTGRVRPGNVYRLYSRALHDKFQEHEQAEVHRQPLHDTILGLRAMLEHTEVFEGMIPILNDLLEPPEMSTVQDSFDFLYKSNMITEPSDDGMLTYTGLFAGQLPVDLQLSRLIVYGISLGVGAESVVLASALSQPKSVFRLASTLVHKDPDEYNEIVRQTFLGSDALDNGMYSQPIMMLRLFLIWRKLTFSEQNEFAQALGIAHSRMRQFNSSTNHLLAKVNDSLHTTFKKFNYDNLSVYFTEQKLTLLRLILTWTNEANIIKFKPNRKWLVTDLHTIEISNPLLSQDQVRDLFPKPIRFKLVNKGRRIYDGALSAARVQNTDTHFVFALLVDILKASSEHGVSIAFVVIEGNEAAPVPQILFGLIDCANAYKDGKKHTAAAQNHVHSLNTARQILLDFFSARLIYNGERPFTHLGVKCRLDTFTLMDPSRRDLKECRIFHDELPAAISLLLPGRGNAKLTASNFVPSKTHLNNIFFRSGLSIDEVAQFETFSALHPHGKISEQVMSSHQTIVFEHPNEATANGEQHGPENTIPMLNKSILTAVGNANAAVGGDKDKGRGNIRDRDRDSKTVVPVSTDETRERTVEDSYGKLIVNIPIGLRLYAAYCSGYKDKKLMLWKEDPESAEDNLLHHGLPAVTASTAEKPSAATVSAQSTPAKKGLVPGSVKWQALKTSTPTQSTPTAGDKTPGDSVSGVKKAVKTPATPVTIATPTAITPHSDNRSSRDRKEPSRGTFTLEQPQFGEDDKVQVNAKIIQTAWEFVRNSDHFDKLTTNPYPKAFMGGGSILSVAVHCGPESWYGVAHNTVTVGKSGDLVLCEGVTMLPLGDKFVLLALLCIGVENGLRAVQPNTSRPQDPDYVSAAELDLTREIDLAFSELKHSPVGVNYDLVDLVETLFVPAVPTQSIHQNVSCAVTQQKKKSEKVEKSTKALTKKGANADRAAQKQASIDRMVNEVDEVFSGFKISSNPSVSVNRVETSGKDRNSKSSKKGGK